MSYETQQQLIVLITLALVTLGLYALKNTPLGFLWKIYKWFWVVLFITLLANYAKDEIKKWLSK